MTCPGLPSKFLRFGTLAHKILLICWRDGVVSQISLQEERWPGLDNYPQAISANLKRLVDAGFLFRCGRVRDGGRRLHWLFQIDDPGPEALKLCYSPMSVKERTRLYRQRKAVRVPSVFHFRGKIEVQDEGKSSVLSASRSRRSTAAGSAGPAEVRPAAPKADVRRTRKAAEDHEGQRVSAGD